MCTPSDWSRNVNRVVRGVSCYAEKELASFSAIFRDFYLDASVR